MNYKYRKKPVVIEAFQMTMESTEDESLWPEWLQEAARKDPSREDGALWSDKETMEVFCGTLEGVHIVSPDDFIIQGVQGELYPCKPDIFWQTYEEVEDGTDI